MTTGITIHVRGFHNKPIDDDLAEIEPRVCPPIIPTAEETAQDKPKKSVECVWIGMSPSKKKTQLLKANEKPGDDFTQITEELAEPELKHYTVKKVRKYGKITDLTKETADLVPFDPQALRVVVKKGSKGMTLYRLVNPDPISGLCSAVTTACSQVFFFRKFRDDDASTKSARRSASVRNAALAAQISDPSIPSYAYQEASSHHAGWHGPIGDGLSKSPETATDDAGDDFQRELAAYSPTSQHRDLDDSCDRETSASASYHPVIFNPHEPSECENLSNNADRSSSNGSKLTERVPDERVVGFMSGDESHRQETESQPSLPIISPDNLDYEAMVKDFVMDFARSNPQQLAYSCPDGTPAHEASITAGKVMERVAMLEKERNTAVLQQILGLLECLSEERAPRNASALGASLHVPLEVHEQDCHSKREELLKLFPELAESSGIVDSEELFWMLKGLQETGILIPYILVKPYLLAFTAEVRNRERLQGQRKMSRKQLVDMICSARKHAEDAVYGTPSPGPLDENRPSNDRKVWTAVTWSTP